MENYRRYFLRITRIAQKYHNIKADHGLTVQETQALRMISNCKGLSQKALASGLGIDKSQVTRLIHKLEKEGYLTRTVHPQDRRKKLLTPTPKADAVRHQDLEYANRYFNWLLDGLSKAEREQFLASLRTLFDRATDSVKNDFAALEGSECT